MKVVWTERTMRCFEEIHNHLAQSELRVSEHLVRVVAITHEAPDNLGEIDGRQAAFGKMRRHTFSPSSRNKNAKSAEASSAINRAPTRVAARR
jgi:hypothetical protein